MSDELLNRNSAPSEPELEENQHQYDEETIRAMIHVAKGAFDFEHVGKMLAEHKPRMFLAMLQKSPMHFTPSSFSGMGKIEAIKYIRNQNGMGLKEAKELLERIGGYNDSNGNPVFVSSPNVFGD